MSARAQFVRELRRETVLARPPIVPELELRLITAACRLWTATESESAAAGFSEPFWAFAWAGGQALARFALDHPQWVSGRRVLDFGAGSGIAGLAALRAGASAATAVDIDPRAVWAAEANARHNGLELRIDTADLIGSSVEEEVVLVGDVTYGRDLTARLVPWLEELSRSKVVLVADPGRGFLGATTWRPLAMIRAPADVDTDGTNLVDTVIYRVLSSGLPRPPDLRP